MLSTQECIAQIIAPLLYPRYTSNDDWDRLDTEDREPLLNWATEIMEVCAAREHPHDAVKGFDDAFGVTLGGSWNNIERRRLRIKLIYEEFQEYMDAEKADNPVETLDALVDMVYVIVGAALEYGMDFAGAFAAVQAANMAKLGPNGKPILRADGKILKPEGWHPADLTPFVHNV